MRILRQGEKGFDRYLSEVEERIGDEDLSFEKDVRSIIAEVRKNGDKALVRYTKLFDKVQISVRNLEMERAEIREAYKKIPADFLKTLRTAARRIQKFHRLQKRTHTPSLTEGKGEILLKQVIRPLERVGIYVPGGKASYPSTVFMAAIPAKVAGVNEIVMTTPPNPSGISPAVLVAANLAGVDRIFRVGGVQAIAGLAYGTETIPRVDKIVGPGNRYVATAKRLVFGTVDIDMVAGPSEIVIVSDGKAPASYMAADMLSQAEHDEMALAVLITTSESFGKEVASELEKQLSSLKREKIARASLGRRGAILIVKSLVRAVDIVNRIAPEHLELCVPDPLSLIPGLKHAGAVFLGAYTPEAIGDYLAGSNHILPTAGTARFSSGLGVEDFMKRINLIRFRHSSLMRFEKDVKRFTEWEGLEGHYRAVEMRRRKR